MPSRPVSETRTQAALSRPFGAPGWRFWAVRPRRPSAIRKASAGYNLVLLMVMVTVLNIMVAKALPLWSQVIQRQKEEDLIFRGLQYAEAIRIFEIRARRLPTKLEELIEIKPRCIRQLWENPMTDDGSWGLIFLNQPGQQQQQGQQNGNRARRNQRRQQQQPQRTSSFGVPGDGKEVKVGPIIGVYSPVGGDAIKTFAPNDGTGGRQISEWQFTKELLQGFAQREVIGLPGNQNANRVPVMNSADIGKPWPPGITLPRNPGNPQRPGGIGSDQGNRGNRGNASGSGRNLGGQAGSRRQSGSGRGGG